MGMPMLRAASTRGIGVMGPEVFDPLRRLGHDGRVVARDWHTSLMLKKHARHAEPPGPGGLLLPMVGNNPQVGVVHEIEEVQLTLPAAPATPYFFRASIAPHH
jgi:hypothetical protein